MNRKILLVVVTIIIVFTGAAIILTPWSLYDARGPITLRDMVQYFVWYWRPF